MTMPLEGVKVLDMGWVMVGPYSGRILSDLGAEVVKLESAKRIDPLRTLGPFKDGVPGPERSLSYHNFNAGKRSVTLDLADPAGREAVLRLVDWADVAIESFRPGVLAGLSLDWPDLSARNPRLIMVSTSLLGSTGPDTKGTPGVGTMGAAMSGASLLVGWPGEAPVGPHGPWTDAITPRFILPAVLAALHRRRETGAGAHLDVSQAEAGLQFYTPLLYAAQANGTSPSAPGLSGAALRAPHGVYACAGEDAWVAIDASADAPWARLRAEVGGALAAPQFDTLLGRLRGRERLDAALSAWTAPQDATGVERRLQAAGVPAHAVSSPVDLARDPELTGAHYARIQDPVFGEGVIEGPRLRFSRTPPRPASRAPRIGEHTREVLAGICGYPPERIDEMEAAGILR
ncbi:MAG: CoA transferase [Pseudomonadota bacterium]|nr:CoA transferase [Pseudomonadota bacterium]